MKNFVNNAPLIPTTSGASTVTSNAMDISTFDDIGIQADTTGTLTGVVAVQVSNNHVQDFMQNVTTPGTWATVTTQAITAGSPSPAFLNVQSQGASYLRVVYTASSGTGNITVMVSGKGL